MGVHVRIPSRERGQVARTKTCWLRERDAAGFSVGEHVSIWGRGHKPLYAGIIVEVKHFRDLEPAGRGRKKDDVYARVSWV